MKPSTMKPSIVAKYEDSQSKEKDVDNPPEELNKLLFEAKIENAELEEKNVDLGPSEKFNKLDLPDMNSEKKPLIPEPMVSKESLLLPEPVAAEVKDNRGEYTGFTIAFKDDSVPLPSLKRQESLSALKAVLDVPNKAEDEKRDNSREEIELFSDARVGNFVHIPPNPYSKPEEVWTGLEVTVKKKDQAKRYMLMSRGLAKWVVDEPRDAGLLALQSIDSGPRYWEIDTAEIVRERGTGPYVKLNIDKEHAVCFYPIKASDGQLKRFMTDNYWPSPTCDHESIKLNSKVEFST